MEHKSIRDKLELLDLNHIDELQWDKERAWNRLNGQLQSTTPRRSVRWYYGITASLAFMIILSGYVMLNNFKSSENNRDFYKNHSFASSIVLKEQVCAEKCESTEPYLIPEEPLKKVLHIAPVFALITKNRSNQDSTIVVSPNIAQKVNDIDDNPSERGTNLNLSEVKVPIEETDITKETITGSNYRAEDILSSVPLERKKYKLPIKFFKRKNKSKSSSEKTMPALTLFASK